MQLVHAPGACLLLIDTLFEVPAINVPLAAEKLKLSYPGAKRNVLKLVEAKILSVVSSKLRPRLYLAPGILDCARRHVYIFQETVDSFTPRGSGTEIHSIRIFYSAYSITSDIRLEVRCELPSSERTTNRRCDFSVKYPCWFGVDACCRPRLVWMELEITSLANPGLPSFPGRKYPPSPSAQ